MKPALWLFGAVIVLVWPLSGPSVFEVYDDVMEDSDVSTSGAAFSAAKWLYILRALRDLVN